MANYRLDIEHARSLALPPLRSFVKMTMARKFGGRWRNETNARLRSTRLPLHQDIDLQLSLRIMDLFWNDVFATVIADRSARNLVHETIAIRNNFAHDSAF
jgi:hypothetical protein